MSEIICQSTDWPRCALPCVRVATHIWVTEWEQTALCTVCAERIGLLGDRVFGPAHERRMIPIKWAGML